MDKKLEKFMIEEMMRRDHGSKTFEFAQKLYKKKVKYSKQNFFQKMWIDFCMFSSDANAFHEVKRIQQGLIDKLVEEYLKKRKKKK